MQHHLTGGFLAIWQDQTRAPRRVEDKLRLFSEALKAGGYPSPDLVITHSGYGH